MKKKYKKVAKMKEFLDEFDQRYYYINLFNLDNNCDETTLLELYRDIKITKLYPQFERGLCDVEFDSKWEAFKFIDNGTFVQYFKNIFKNYYILKIIFLLLLQKI